MADAQIGPLANVPIQLFKAAFLPSSKDRSEIVRKRYFSYAQGTKQGSITQEFVIDGTNPDGKQKRRRIYKKKRLPKLGSEEEMQKVWNWIDKGLQLKELRVSSREEAYEVIRKGNNRYKKHNQERHYEGYPLVSNDERAQSDGSHGSERISQRQESASSISSADGLTSQGAGANVTCRMPDDDTASATEEDRVYNSTVCQLVKAAKHDIFFFLLRKIDEDMRECKLDCVAAALVEIHNDGELSCNTMLLNALKYARLRQSRSKDTRAYEEQRKRVRINVSMLKLIRRGYTDLRLYEEMRWTDFPYTRPSLS